MWKPLKKYFIPHEAEQYRPHSLRPKSVGLILGIAFLLQIIGIVIFFPTFSGRLEYLAAVLPSVLIAQTNETRTEAQLGTLTENATLVAAAQLKANDMAARGYFAHVDPDGNQPWHFLQLVGYQYTAAGENLAVNFVDSKDVHRAWMNSETHRANIVRPQFSEIGIATAEGMYKGKQAIFVVQFFGIPKPVEEPAFAAAPTLIALANETEDTANILNDNITPETVLSDAEVRGAETAAPTQIVAATHTAPTFWERIASAPRSMILYIFAALLTLACTALLLKIFVQFKIQDKRLIAHGALLIAILATMLIINYMLGGYVGAI